MSMRRGLLLGSAILLGAHAAAAEQVLKTIPVGGGPTFSIGNPDGTRIYVGNAETATVTVIDTGSDSVVDTISLSHNNGALQSIHLAMTPDGAYLYAVDENVESTGTVNIISTVTHSVVGTIGVGARPTQIAIRPDGTEAYVVNHHGFSVTVITTADWRVATVPIPGDYPLRVAFSSDGRRAYVTRYGFGSSGGLTILDTATRAIVGDIQNAGADCAPYVAPDGSKLYVTYYDPAADGRVVLRVISTDTANDIYGVTAELIGPAASAWLAMAPDAAKGYLFSSIGATAQVFDGREDRFAYAIDLPGPTAHPFWDATAGRVFVPHFQSNIVTVIDVVSDTIVATHQTGYQPWFVTMAAGKKYVTNRADGTVSVIGEPPPIVPTYTTLRSSLNPSTYGQAVTLSAAVTGDDGIPTGAVEFFDGTTSLGVAPVRDGKASLETKSIGAGARSVMAVYTPTGNFANGTSPVLMQDVAKATGTASSLTLSVLTPQYSDMATFWISFTPSIAGGPAPAKVSFKVGNQIMGEAAPSFVGGVYRYTWIGQLLDPEGTASRQMKPDFRPVTATFVDPNFTAPNPLPKAMTIQKEDARVAYTGPTALSLAAGGGSVTLTATVKDISAVAGDLRSDPYPGDIRNATVSFIDRSTNMILGTVTPTISGADSTVGTATFKWSPNLGTASSRTYKIGLIVSYYYNRNSTADDVYVVVSR